MFETSCRKLGIGVYKIHRTLPLLELGGNKILTCGSEHCPRRDGQKDNKRKEHLSLGQEAHGMVDVLGSPGVPQVEDGGNLVNPPSLILTLILLAQRSGASWEHPYLRGGLVSPKLSWILWVTLCPPQRYVKS